MKAQTNAEAKSLAEIVHCRDCLYGQKFYTPPSEPVICGVYCHYYPPRDNEIVGVLPEWYCAFGKSGEDGQ